jgi:cytochrome c5
MARILRSVSAVLFLCALGLFFGFRGIGSAPAGAAAGGNGVSEPDRSVVARARTMIEEGRRTFRFDTFGDERFWGDALGIHRAIAGAALGGVGPGVGPRAALGVGLKVDVDALPRSLQDQLKAGLVDLDSPKTTIALLKLHAVVGLTGFLDDTGSLRSVGIQCALCHSTVDNSFAPGIGHRLDGWANRDLDVGAVVGLSPDLTPVAGLLGVDEATVRTVLASWGPGKFDAALFLDGKAFRPDGATAATLLPPAFGLAGVNLHTWTGWGSVTHWNAFVANLEMHGQGVFFDPRLDDAARFPIAAANGFGHVRNDPDLVTPKLAALHFYQLALEAPRPPRGSFDAAAAARGESVFNGKARCASCHVPPIYTEPGWNLHAAAEIGIDDFQAGRSPDRRYRTTPLKGLWTHQKGGFYHDGRFATLDHVIGHYDTFFSLDLSAREKSDLVQYLKSL